MCLAEIVGKRRRKWRNYAAFGKSIHWPEQNYESMWSNGLQPFATMDEAESAAHQLLGSIQYLRSVSIIWLLLEIATTAADLEEFKTSRNFIVIGRSKVAGLEAVDAYGRKIKKASTIPGNLLTENGFRPFRHFPQAIHCASELARQSQSHVQLARATTVFYQQLPKR